MSEQLLSEGCILQGPCKLLHAIIVVIAMLSGYFFTIACVIYIS